jgi:diaminohydroxyphosphoribosylaminopyrimidine deaminase/5-amino-6-(5-phosphoribosylamino)uracil reductase
MTDNQDSELSSELKKPFIHVKIAQTLDAIMATCERDSKWITSETLRKESHKLRASYAAVMVGMGTIFEDNPQLTVRYNIDVVQQPYRIIVGNCNNLNGTEHILTDEYKDRTIIVSTEENLKNWKHMNHIVVPRKDRLLDLKYLMNELVKRNINFVFVEGGPRLISSLLNERLVDKVTYHIAPKLTGSGVGLYFGKVDKIADGIEFNIENMSILDNHFVFDGYPKYKK